MQSKKIFIMIFALLFLTALFCSCGDVIVEPNWVVGIKGADARVFSSLDYVKLNEVTVTVESTSQDGSAAKETWKGVRFKDILDYLGVKEYSSITLVSSDDYSVEYTPDVVNDSLTILGTNLNGKDIKHEDGYIEAVAANQPDSMRVKKLSKITVN